MGRKKAYSYFQEIRLVVKEWIHVQKTIKNIESLNKFRKIFCLQMKSGEDNFSINAVLRDLLMPCNLASQKVCEKSLKKTNQEIQSAYLNS